AGIVGRVERTTGHNLQAIPKGRTDEHRNLGVAFLRTGMLDEALREFRRVLELDPSDAKARAYCGLVLLRRGMWQEGSDLYHALATEPDARISTLHNLAFALERLGHYAEAATALSRAMEMGGDADARVLTSLGIVTLLMGDARDAERLFADAQLKFPAH